MPLDFFIVVIGGTLIGSFFFLVVNYDTIKAVLHLRANKDPSSDGD